MSVIDRKIFTVITTLGRQVTKIVWSTDHTRRTQTAQQSWASLSRSSPRSWFPSCWLLVRDFHNLHYNV